MNTASRNAQEGGPEEQPPKVTRKIAAEAAMWVARLHGPSRSREMELKCLEWQALSAAHRHAFERCTDIWMEVPNAARAAGYVAARAPPEAGEQGGGGKPRTKGPLTLAVVGVLALAGGALALLHRGADDDYRTVVGETRTVLLEDGTRMSLNTDTTVRVDFRTAQRNVNIQAGEAAFEVAKDAKRPFVVRAAASEVVALGTIFSVRLTRASAVLKESLAVTLVEGQVSLRPAANASATQLAPAQAVLMRPGERVRLMKNTTGAAAAAQQLDRPRLEQVLAWKRNEAVFDQASLGDAVAEMNRYSHTPLVLVGDLVQVQWRVSGQFRTGDNVAFANALAALHGLVVNEREGRLELSLGP